MHPRCMPEDMTKVNHSHVRSAVPNVIALALPEAEVLERGFR
jgi:hypothetical protein